MPTIGISSTMVRERVGAGLPIRYLVPEQVLDHIQRGGLYRTDVPVAATPPPVS
jgi:nicotinate-nucleotide adenylyltransferase